MIRFLCSGRLGDFIHQLYSVKRICEERGEKAHIVVGGDEIGEAFNFSKPTPEAVEDLKDLLYAQDYIQWIEAYSGQSEDSFDYFPSRYRDCPLLWKSCWTSIHNDFFNFPSEYNYSSWLKVDPDPSMKEKVVIHRARKANTQGYPDRCTDIIDWDHLIQNNECVFIGFETWQYDLFVQEISPESISKLEFIVYDSILEFCRAIAGSKLFIGNQSSPLAMAQALDVPRLGELSNGDSVHYVGEEKYFPKMNWVSDSHPSWILDGISDKVNLKLNMKNKEQIEEEINKLSPFKSSPVEDPNKIPKKPTLCLATVCKNEEECIERLLESVHQFIDYWVIVDTGSTDRTCEIIEEYFRKKGIPGELHHDEWVSMGHNKTKMLEYAKDKTDYLIHVDADDYMVGQVDRGDLTEGNHAFFFTVLRGGTKYKTWVVFDNRITWRFIGVAHTLIRCVEFPNFQTLDLSEKPYYMVSVLSGGARSQDPEKYYKDALNLQKQFFDTLLDDPDDLNIRSVFYTAQSYFDCGRTEDALRWYRLYTRMSDGWIEEKFESHMRIARCMMLLGWDLNKIIDQMSIAIEMFPDRSEPLYHLGIYCNNAKEFEHSYKYLSQAKTKSLEEVQKKYSLFVDIYTYGDFVKDELSVACYWTGRYREGYKYLTEIIEAKNPNLDMGRILENEKHFQNMMG
jgi:glycosyltransferase involved in cell wall biosynthesis